MAKAAQREAFEIRRATADDAGCLAAFWRDRFAATFGPIYPPEDLTAYLAAAYDPATITAEITDAGFNHHLAERTGALQGALKTGRVGLPLPETEGLWEVHRLYLAPEAFGTGLADALMDIARAEARGLGAKALVLGVYSANHRAQRFYARHGFERIGGYQFPVGRTLDDEWIMQAAL